MQFGEFEEKGLIVRTKVNFRKIYDFLSRSEKDLQTSMANLKIDKEWSYTIAYHAMLRAGRALMMSFGFRPKGKDQHRTIVKFTDRVFGAQFKDLVREFDRMRRKRHEFIYEPTRPIAKQEAKHAVDKAAALVKQILLFVEEKNPQKELIADFNEGKG